MSERSLRWQRRFLGPDLTGYVVPFHVADDATQGRFVGPVGHAEVAVVVVTYNSADDIDALIRDLRSVAAEREVRLVVVDNESADGTVALVRQHNDVVVVESGGNKGYAAGLNAGMRAAGECRHFLFLNPDLRIATDAVSAMIDATRDPVVGAVVPVIAEPDGSATASLRREPSVSRGIGAALFGSRIRPLPSLLSEIDHRRGSYTVAHDVEWATGAALLVPAGVVRSVGSWDEDFFLYSEEVDYCRRIRALRRTIRFEPAAVVMHRGAGSGAPPNLTALLAVNSIRYFEKYHGRARSFCYRSAVALSELLRSYDEGHRQALSFVANRRRWRELPHYEDPSV